MRPLVPAMRALLVVATVLVALAGISLYLAPGRTDQWFSWTVNPPLTAAFLGAAYWASAAVEAGSARARTWADARVAVPGVLTFTALTFIVTLVHLDAFHLGGEVSLLTRGITWAWLAIYAIVPVVLAVLLLVQTRVPGVDPARERPLPRWLRAAVAGMAVVLLAVGVVLLVAPEQAGSWWPWQLSALTGRAIGAWLVGLGVSAASTWYENDARRARPVAIGALVLPVLAGVALMRFAGTLGWDDPSAWLLVAALTVWAGLGTAILRTERRPAHRERAA